MWAGQDRALLPGSEREPLPQAQLIRKTLRGAFLTVTVILHPQRELPEAGSSTVEEDSPADSAEAHARLLGKYGASETDIAKILAFAWDFDLIVMETNKGTRTVKLAGTVPQIEQAFHVDLYDYELAHGDYRGRTGGIFLPASLVEIVSGVFGLDDRPIGRAHLQRREETPEQTNQSFMTEQIAQLYRFPREWTGEGQAVALVEFNFRHNGALRGTGYVQADLTRYFEACGVAQPAVQPVLVSGGINDPGVDPIADAQVLLDIQVVGAVAPGAALCVYFAPNSEQGWIDVLNAILSDPVHRPSVICLGWGAPENAEAWSGQLVREMERTFRLAALLGVTICCASGEGGSVSTGAPPVDYPAASPGVLGCGGTALIANDAAILAELPWDDGDGISGGGISAVFSQVPSWQRQAIEARNSASERTGRGVPDVAGHASPVAGYRILHAGQWRVIGGTSAAAALWAGLVACCNQGLRRRLGFINPRLYRLDPAQGVFRDILGKESGAGTAAQGWDVSTGLGSVNGSRLLEALLDDCAASDPPPVAKERRGRTLRAPSDRRALRSTNRL